MRLALALLFCFFAQNIYASPSPVLKTIPVDHIYAPSGFDTNDNVEVIITGYLPNLCYKYPQTKTSVSDTHIFVSIEAQFYVPEDGFCAEAAIPFVETVNLGVLKSGVFDVLVNSQSPQEDHRGQTTLQIENAPTDAIDNFIYAGVESIKIHAQSKTVSLIGNNPSNCFEFKEIKIISNNKDTLSVLPILEQVAEFCPLTMVPFEYQFEVPETVQADKVLLHVRSMNGKSVNAIFENVKN